ncbi:MAG: zinc ribbon domain-containing protein [Elusimicrobia bacterium]|nr:zinc ribbon domain-containing protein [Elusimicrobiota bacterium]
MIDCPKCSRPNADDALYCDQCRTAVSPDVPGEVHADPCPACGGAIKEVPSVLSMCQDCGIPLGETGPGGAHQEHAEPKPAAQEPETGEKTPCPVCGTENAGKRCKGCLLNFEKSHEPLPCPKCEAEATGDTCSCGAILTLPKLLSFLDKSVRVVCPVCKQLFTVERKECSDCGAETRSADSLKAFAASR